MSKLDDIFDQYRKDCFLAKDAGLDNDRSVNILAYSGVISKQQIKDLMLEMINEQPPFAHLWHASEANKVKPVDGNFGEYNRAKWGAIEKAQEELRQKVNEL